MFDVVEAYYCLAHDFGLYALFNRIEKYFKARPDLCFDTLTAKGREVYLSNERRAKDTEYYELQLRKG